MAIDFNQIKFKIARIDYEGVNKNIKYYVLTPIPKVWIHLYLPTLVDDAGNEYRPATYCQKKISKKQYEYYIDFDDEDPNLQIGQTFSLKRAEGYPELPKCKLVGVDYEEIGHGFMTGEISKQVKVSIREDGNASIFFGKSLNRSTEFRKSLHIGKISARHFLDEMLQCVAGDDCYPVPYVDDTGRQAVYHFENGQAVTLDGTYGYEEEKNSNDIVKTMWKFIGKYEKKEGPAEKTSEEKPPKEKPPKVKESKEQQVDKVKMDDALRKAIDQYNEAYTMMNDMGATLYRERTRAVDTIVYVEDLINSIANHPKDFDTEIVEIQKNRESFMGISEFAKKELDMAKKSALNAGAGAATSAAIVSVAPTVAMWVATTFGTASTGTAISALSGAAATNAALAWLGGGALAAGGGGMAAGQAFLALAGPVGWSVAGITLLSSIVLFSLGKMKLNKKKKEEIEAVMHNTSEVQKVGAAIQELLDEVTSLRDNLSQQYHRCLTMYGNDFISIPKEQQMELGALVNNAKALSVSLKKNI